MVVTYTTTDKVAQILGFPAGHFDTASTPTAIVIENFINRAEDQIDFSTGHAWRAATITEEYLEPSSTYRYGTGISFNLLNRSINSINSLFVWDGSNWIDWIATKTEGRNADYWIDDQNGVIYLVTLNNVFPRGVYSTYVFGESSVPGSIEEAATKIAALEIITSPEFSSVVFTENGQSYTRHDGRIKNWQDKVNQILLNNSEFKLIN